MKTFLIVAAFCVTLSTVFGCDSNCYEKSDNCDLDVVKTWCEDPNIGTHVRKRCPVACNVCTPCEPVQPRTCTRENDPCQDRSDRCHLFAPTQCDSGSLITQTLVRRSCPRSCGICTPCKSVVEELPPCHPECADDLIECPYWAKNGYCKNPWHGSFMKKNCKLSCKICIDCFGNLPNQPATKRPRPVTTRRPRPVTTRRPRPETTRRPRPVTTRRPRPETTRRPRPETTRRPRPETTRRPRPETTIKPETVTPRDPLILPTERPTPIRTTAAPATTRRPATTEPIDQEPAGTLECSRNEQTEGPISTQCLNAHNYFRCLHGAKPLKYDYKLQRSAENYAKKLASQGFVTDLEASQIGVDRPGTVGENLAAMEGNNYTVNDAVVAWYASGLEYDYGLDEPETGTVEFTQMLWKETKSVGCALRKRAGKVYVVVHYQVAGNDPGFFYDNVGFPNDDTCLGGCDAGTCQGHEGRQTCMCDTRDNGYHAPLCAERCVVHCKKPEGHSGPWKESCEGATVCTCIDKTEPQMNITDGAFCK